MDRLFMYAVIRTGGKQYRVAENQRVTVERLPGGRGDTVKFDDVLMIAEDGSAPLVGTPGLDKAAVFAEVVAQTRGDKVIVFKKKRRKNYRRTKGHRQEQTMLRIASISASGKAPAVKKSAVKAEAVAETPVPEDEVAKNAAATEQQVQSQVASPSETAPESDSKE
jgi:large subunit ribosomal protein L21